MGLIKPARRSSGGKGPRGYAVVNTRRGRSDTISSNEIVVCRDGQVEASEEDDVLDEGVGILITMLNRW